MHFSTKVFSIFLVARLIQHCYSQEIKKGEVYNYGRQIVDTMASAGMHGRGYVMGGDSIAAVYLKNEFQKLGLEQLGKEYYQRFSFPINTFPDNSYFGFTFLKKMSPEYQTREIIPGKDYIVSPSSSSSKPSGSWSKVLLIDSSVYYNPKKLKSIIRENYFYAIDLKNVPDREIIDLFIKKNIYIRGLIFLKRKKLTHSLSQVVNPFPSVQVLIPDDIDIRKKFKKEYAQLEIYNEFISNHKTQNVIGYVKGSHYPDSFIVFSAHYDHLGHMGKDVYFPGANDNASGCAMLLNLAKHYAKPENKPKYSMVFMAFAGEEVGILGSKYYTENPIVPLKNTKFVFNMDLMGTGEDGITVVNGAIFKTEFEKLKQINTENNYLKEIKMRGKAANSDHYYFSEKGVKSFFIYTMGGIAAYHDIYDKPETLPLTEFEDLFQLIVKFGDYLQN